MVVFNRLIYLFAFISLSSYVSAQEHSDFKTNEKLRDLYIERVSEQNASFATTYVGEYKSKFQTLYRKRSKDAKYYAENDVYLFEPSSLEYLNTLKNKIAVANQQFDFSGVNLVIAKFPWANAYSTGDGTIAVIPDIVTFYDNEDQLTYLLCHEFAHYFSRHFERQITKTYDYIESDEFKDRVKEINRMEYGKNTSAVALLNDNLYSQRSHSRRYEREADSLGLVLYLNASLCATESVNEVRKLGEMSEEFDKSSVLIFDRLGLPKSAGEPNEMMNIHDAERESKWDLVKSHPDVEQREEWILEEVERRQEEICETAPTDEFLKFKMQMEFESCNILVEYDMVDAALIKSERLRIKYPNVRIVLFNESDDENIREKIRYLGGARYKTTKYI